MRTITYKKQATLRPTGRGWMAAIVLAVGLLTGSGCTSVDDRLNALSAEQNAVCPIHLGGGVNLVRVVALPDRHLVYNCEYFGDSETTEEAKQAQLTALKELAAATLESLKSDPESEPLRKLGVTFDYRFRNQLGDSLHAFLLTPADYE